MRPPACLHEQLAGVYAYQGPALVCGARDHVQLLAALSHRFELVCRDVSTGVERVLTASAVLVCTGILGAQARWTHTHSKPALTFPTLTLRVLPAGKAIKVSG